MTVRVRFCVAVGMGMAGVGSFGELAVFEDVDFGAGDAAAVYGFDLEGCAQVEGGGGAVQDGGIDAGFEEGSEEHVSADASEAV
jgi:hypothetical protein